MLSKLFNSARNIFNPVPQPKNNRQSPTGTATTLKQEMVTTRGQTGKPVTDDDVEDSIVVETPSSSRKRQRKSRDAKEVVLDEEYEKSPATKKQKVLPVRAKDEVPLKNTRPVVEIPSSQTKLESLERTNRRSKNGRNAKKEDAEEVQNSDASLSDSGDDDDSVEELEYSRKSDAPSPEKTRRNKKDTQDSSPPKLPALIKPKHKRFASEEPEPEFFSTALEKPEADEDEESEDEDEAPEVVGAQEALESAKFKEREAQKAAEEQEAAIRQKRKERDDALKKQAELASKKRKREEARKPVAATNETDAKPLPSIEAEDVIIEETEEQQPNINIVKPSRIRFDADLPEFLPEEYLQDDENEDAMVLDDEQPAKKVRRTKFTNLIEKKPKDRRKGSTIYRVSETSSKRLAPKASNHARNIKQDWLQGRSGSILGASRKPFNTGFFKKK